MNTYLFNPNPDTPFQFQPTLDGQLCTVIITWNLYAQRWYINIYDASNDLVVSKALIGSPPNYDINLAYGYFTTSTIVFRVSTQNFEVSP